MAQLAPKNLLTNRPPYRNLMGEVTFEQKMKIFGLIGYEPHEGQLPIHRSNARIRTVCCGRRFGKSKLAAAEAVVCAVLGGGAWAVAPDYDLSTIVFDEAMAFVTQSELASQLAAEPRTSKGRQMMVFKSGGWILGKSSHKPRSLLGRGLDLVVYDEAATEDNAEILHQYLRPVLIDRVGHLLPISTPRGDNWFKTLFDRGQERSVEMYRSWQMPTATNPHITEKEIKELGEDYPELFWRQEILAEFLEATGALFRGYREVSILEEMGTPYDPSMGYAIGVDLGRHEDYTVVCVIELATGREVWLERFNQLDWLVIEERIARACEKWPAAPVLVDSTGVGDRSYRALEDLITDRPIEPFVFTNISKVNVINQLALAIQDREVWFIGKEVKDHLTGYELGRYSMGEMSAYRYERTPGGKLTMNAPPGKHDDVVIARALALECALRYGGTMRRPAAGATIGQNRPEEAADALREQFSGNAPQTGVLGRDVPKNFGSAQNLRRRFGKK